MSQSTPEHEVAEIVARSGNTFHCKVINYFRERGWDTAVSPYYVDQMTDKAREIDLIASKRFIPDTTGAFSSSQTATVRLFIECKYLLIRSVFWFDQRKTDGIEGWLHRNTAFHKMTDLRRHHHYMATADSVAKLYASTKTNGGIEKDPIYGALNQCLHGYIHRRDPPARAARTKLPILYQYPLIVFSDFSKLHRIEMSDPLAAPRPISTNFLMEVDYSWLTTGGTQRDDFYVDMVAFGMLDEFLERLSVEVGHAAYLAD